MVITVDDHYATIYERVKEGRFVGYDVYADDKHYIVRRTFDKWESIKVNDSQEYHFPDPDQPPGQSYNYDNVLKAVVRSILDAHEDG